MVRCPVFVRYLLWVRVGLMDRMLGKGPLMFLFLETWINLLAESRRWLLPEGSLHCLLKSWPYELEEILLTAPGYQVGAWAQVIICVELFISSPSPGSPVSSYLQNHTKTMAYTLNCPLNVNACESVCAWCSSIHWCPMQGVFTFDGTLKIFYLVEVVPLEYIKYGYEGNSLHSITM